MAFSLMHMLLHHASMQNSLVTAILLPAISLSVAALIIVGVYFQPGVTATMPPKRTKKASVVPKTQGRLNFERQPKPQASVPPLIQVLSQYQLMIMVTDQLSSADIIHLTSTCREIKTYLTDDETIYTRIKDRALCDGKGIEARAKCFGHWKGDVTKAQVECEGIVSEPCDGCHAMVCNNCRYHITYLDDLPCCKNDAEHWESHEADFASVIETVRLCHADHCGECPDFHSGNFPIEGIRAALLAGEPRERRFCTDCRPDLDDGDGDVDVEAICDIIAMHEMDGNWCFCTLSEKFIEERWLCIPCFFKLETEAYSRRSKREIYKWEMEEGVKTRKHVKTEYFCDCGKVANVGCLALCRWCDDYIRTAQVDEFMEY
ncbi:hypothetical protein D6C78_06090 [Aureobasidium pullulans]|uniref:Uncharacterized protein n=1 Tax=Aureobasidium pullulans TaxID=5580 RepID=A0A4T0BMG2_AURPU|nr:hypothetical protein D6C78_06090 [Aureobasidium pullulans]